MTLLMRDQENIEKGIEKGKIYGMISAYRGLGLPEEDICQLLLCQPEDLIEWKVDPKPESAYETRFKNEE